MTSRLLIAIVLGAALAFACARTSPALSTDAEVQKINQVRERELAAFSQGNVDQLLTVFTPDAVLTPPGEPQVSGSEALRKWASGISNQFTVAGEYTGSKVTVAGDWAIEEFTGTLTLTPKAGGQPTRDRMRGMHVYQRSADGTWRIVRDVWNTEASAVNDQANIERVRQANQQLLNEGRTQDVASFFAPQYVAHLTEQELRGAGPDVARAFVGALRTAFPDLRVNVEVLAAQGDRVAWQRTSTGTHRAAYSGIAPSGRRIVWRDMVVTRFSDGKIAEEWAVSDLLERITRP